MSATGWVYADAINYLPGHGVVCEWRNRKGHKQWRRGSSPTSVSHQPTWLLENSIIWTVAYCSPVLSVHSSLHTNPHIPPFQPNSLKLKLKRQAKTILIHTGFFVASLVCVCDNLLPPSPHDIIITNWWNIIINTYHMRHLNLTYTVVFVLVLCWNGFCLALACYFAVLRPENNCVRMHVIRKIGITT